MRSEIGVWGILSGEWRSRRSRKTMTWQFRAAEVRGVTVNIWIRAHENKTSDIAYAFPPSWSARVPVESRQ